MNAHRARLKGWVDRGVTLIMLVLVVYVLTQRVPGWVRQWGLEGQSVSGPLEALSLDGQVVDLADLGADKKVLVFWATWCGPCTAELGRLRSAVLEGDISRDSIYAVSVGEDVELVRKTSQEREYPFHVLIDRGDLANKFSVEVTPTVVFLAPGGRIDWVTTGISPLLMVRTRSFLGEKSKR